MESTLRIRNFSFSALRTNGSDSNNNFKGSPPGNFTSEHAAGSHRRDNIFQDGSGAGEFLDDTEVIWRGPGYDSDLTQSFAGVSKEKFPDDVVKVLLEPLNRDDVEILPSEWFDKVLGSVSPPTFLLQADGVPYLPEIKFRRVLNRAFGPGAWGLVPRGKHTLIDKTLTREYALFCMGRFVSQARGMMEAYDKSQLPNATEGVKSNALTRCCKDLGIGSELWDPVWVRAMYRHHRSPSPRSSGKGSIGMDPRDRYERPGPGMGMMYGGPLVHDIYRDRERSRELERHNRDRLDDRDRDGRSRGMPVPPMIPVEARFRRSPSPRRSRSRDRRGDRFDMPRGEFLLASSENAAALSGIAMKSGSWSVQWADR
ncbi:hypothetical protein HDU93_003779 [Gonapodya sp. JEL0774]|nr:hypothetical protein HDU93_003779 [Gonapodya sp. JEL0774]